MNTFFGGGAIFLAVCIALTAAFNWPKWFNYVWAVLALVWGLMAIL